MIIYLYIALIALIFMIIEFFMPSKFKIKNNAFLSAKTPLLMIVILIIMFAIMAFRNENIGQDLPNYLYMLSRINHLPFDFYIRFYDIEPFFVILEKLLLIIFPLSYRTFFIIITSFSVMLLLFKTTNKLSCDKLLSIFLFITFTFYNQSFNIIRQYIAMFLVLYSISYLIKGKHVIFFIIVLIAALLHNTAIIGLIIYPIYILYVKKGKKISKLCILIVIFGILGYFLSDFIIPLIANIFGYSKYIERNTGGELGIGIVINSFLFILFLLFNKQSTNHDKAFPIWLFLSAFTLMVNFFTLKFSLLSRIILYGRCAYIISIPSFIHSFENKSTRSIIYMLCILLFIIYYVYIICSESCYNTIPYASNFFNFK